MLSGRAFLAALTGSGSQGWYKGLFSGELLHYVKIRDCEVALISEWLRRSRMGAGSKAAESALVGIMIRFRRWAIAIQETVILSSA